MIDSSGRALEKEKKYLDSKFSFNVTCLLPSVLMLGELLNLLRQRVIITESE